MRQPLALIPAYERQSSIAARTRSVTSAAVAFQSDGTEISNSGYKVIRTANFRRSGVATIQPSKSLVRCLPPATTAASSSALRSRGMLSESKTVIGTVYDCRKSGFRRLVKAVTRRQLLLYPSSRGKVVTLPILTNKRHRMNELTVVDKPTDWRRMKSLVLDSVSSPITKRVYSMALDEFFDWYRLEPRPGFSKATVNAWRVTLDERGLGSSSIIVRMSAIRKLAVEATDNGLLAPELAAGIQRVKSAKSIGVRAGNWLSLKQSQTLLNAPDISTLKGLRDRAMIAVLLGCALRRSEVAALTMAHVQRRDGRWCIVDLYGKHRRVRTIPMPAWVKVASLLATLFAAVAVGATRANVARQVRISSVRRYGSPRQLFVAHQPSAASRNCVQSRAILFWASARSIFPFFTWAVR